METPDAKVRRLEERVERLEELHAHAERRHEELNGALLDLAARLAHLGERVGGLERTLRAQRPPAPPESEGADPDD